MPTITALLHTENDALRLGRCLETLYPCDEIVVIDHGSDDDTIQVAREYGARVVEAGSQVQLPSLEERWTLCLDPRESLSEALAASLYEWKSERHAEDIAAGAVFSVFLREETVDGWLENPEAQVRLVPPGWTGWRDRMPQPNASAIALEGELLRFVFP
jgi:glycosyltransferase involved in cell wall biosynthesis